MIDILKGEINFLKSAWQNLLGRPLVTLVLRNIHIGPLCHFLFCFVSFIFIDLCAVIYHHNLTSKRNIIGL